MMIAAQDQDGRRPAVRARAFGIAGGDCLFVLAVVSVIVRLRKRRRPRQVTQADGVRDAAGAESTVAATTLTLAPFAPAAERLVPDAEFDIQKARLLAEI